jgi:hypothetical protein
MTSLLYCTQTRLVGEQEYVFHRNDTVPDMDGPWYMRVSGLLLYIYNPSWRTNILLTDSIDRTTNQKDTSLL